MKARLSKISIEPGIVPETQSIRLQFNNGRFHQVEIAGPHVEHIEAALIMLLHNLRDDHNLRETEKETLHSFEYLSETRLNPPKNV